MWFKHLIFFIDLENEMAEGGDGCPLWQVLVPKILKFSKLSTLKICFQNPKIKVYDKLGKGTSLEST
jgi:hypothetical protein